MSCDGSPGNPGTYVQRTEDGPDHVACRGCLACRTDVIRSLDDPRIQTVVKAQNAKYRDTAKG